MYCPYWGANLNRSEVYYGNLFIDKGINLMNIGEKGWIILDTNPASTGYLWNLVPDNSETYMFILLSIFNILNI